MLGNSLNAREQNQHHREAQEKDGSFGTEDNVLPISPGDWVSNTVLCMALRKCLGHMKVPGSVPGWGW